MPKSSLDKRIPAPETSGNEAFINRDEIRPPQMPTFSDVLQKMGVPNMYKIFSSDGPMPKKSDSDAVVTDKMLESRMGKVPWKYPLDRYDPEIRKGIVDTNDQAIRDVLKDPRLIAGLGDVHHKVLSDNIFNLHPQLRAELYPFLNDFANGSGKVQYESVLDQMDSMKNPKRRI